MECFDDPASQIRGIQRQSRIGQGFAALTTGNRNTHPEPGNFMDYSFGSFLRLKTRLCCRANGAEDASPGQRPGNRAWEASSALKERRIPAPFQGAKQSINFETQGVALG